MKLLTSLTSVSVPLRANAQTLFSAVVAFAVIGLEVAGRFAESDRHDGLAALALLCLIAAVAAWHRHRPLGWVDWIVRRAGRVGKRLTKWNYEHGIDFGGQPPFPRRMPPVAWTIAAALVAWGVFAVVVWYLLPGGWREIGTHTSYVAYLFVMLALWGALLVGLIAGLFVPVVLLDRTLQDVLNDSNRRTLIFFACIGYLLAVSLAAFFLPVGGVLAVCAVAVGVALWHWTFPGRAELAVLWRQVGKRTVYAVPFPRLLAGALLVAIVAYVNLILTACGGRITTLVQPNDAMRLTGFLAALVAWTAPGLLVISGWRVWVGMSSNPARQTPPTVHLGDRPDPATVGRVREIVSSWGWFHRLPDEAAQKTDVHCQVVPSDKSEATDFEPQWPLKVAVADLANPDVKHRLLRRDEIQLRRKIFRGVRLLFKKAVADREHKGGGFWFAPHWWFVDSLGREDRPRGRRAEDAPGSLKQIGPSFGRVFGVRPRQHLYKILRALKVDVVYVEDGVPVKAVEKVLRQAMEVYDVHDGRRPVDDHTFRDIPKVRVTVHDFGPDATAMVHDFRQPTFDDLSRGRVLHIYRDSGDHEEPVDIPHDWFSAPSPAEPMLVA